MELGRGVRSSEGIRVVGWRAWTVVETKDGVRLASVLYDTVWSPDQPVLATCECGQTHPAPTLDCTCGFYAARDPVDALTYLRGRDEPRTICRVFGEVLLSGVVFSGNRRMISSYVIYPASFPWLMRPFMRTSLSIIDLLCCWIISSPFPSRRLMCL